MLAGPLRDFDTGEVLGMLKIESIGFLDLSTIFLLREDKQAYTYQTQLKEASLIGREFAGGVSPFAVMRSLRFRF